MKPTILLCQFRRDQCSIDLERASFLRSSGLAAEQFRYVDMLKEKPSVDVLRPVTGIILGGSPLSVSQVPHKDDLAVILKVARLSGYPILGVCFGAQLIADLWGGTVTHSPTMQEFGTYTIELTGRGMSEGLFEGLPQAFLAQCSHHDRILDVPLGAVQLAKSSLCPVQAFGYPGFDIYGVQFHPERSKPDFEACLAHRRDRPGADHAEIDETLSRLRETPLAERVVSNFVRRHVSHFYPFC